MTQPAAPRARYIALAARRFAADGFHGASLSALAEDAGVSKQALLHFFKTKARLYAEVLSDLAARLAADIDAVQAETPQARLAAVLQRQASGAMARPQDARLVVRALLDSDPEARAWPLKPYLDRLTALVLACPAWAEAEEAEALAAVYRLLGAIQYFAVSAPTLEGMYGADGRAALEARFACQIDAMIEELAAPAPRPAPMSTPTPTPQRLK